MKHEVIVTIDFSERTTSVLTMLAKALTGWSVDVTPAAPVYLPAPDTQAPEQPREATPAPAPSPSAPAEEKPFNAATESRRIIDATRERLLTSPEIKEMFGKHLTSAFKDIAAKLGAPKPSLLESREQMAKFEELCAQINISGSKLLTPDCPF